jgi:Spy/CpxP family protein refolding chaperone
MDRPQMDPEQMMQRMMERIMERLNLSADESAVLKPMIEGIMQTRQEQASEMRELTDALQKAVDDKDSERIKAKLTDIKAKRKSHREKNDSQEKELIELLTVEQEAQLTLAGVVNSGGGFGFGGFRGFGGTRQRNRPNMQQ